MGAGSMLEAIGDDEAAEERYLAGLRDWEALDDPAGGRARRPAPRQCRGRARPTAKRSIGTSEPVSSASQLRDEGVIAGAVSDLGSVAYFRGDYGRAEEHWNEAAAFFRAGWRHQPLGVDPQQPGRAGGAAR